MQRRMAASAKMAKTTSWEMETSSTLDSVISKLDLGSDTFHAVLGMREKCARPYNSA